MLRLDVENGEKKENRFWGEFRGRGGERKRPGIGVQPHHLVEDKDYQPATLHWCQTDIDLLDIFAAGVTSFKN